ncbi:sphingomyelin phosphodiesterase [Linepithema humile]|uniref:sphingomyelin phosphodiesterase n=1 Tax=Linepithema humile TaxID=83485 RepID=UPI00351E54EE
MWLCKLLPLALFLKVANSNGISYEAQISSFSNEIENWVISGEESEIFKNFIHDFAIPTSLQRDSWRSFTGERSTGVCTICRSVLKAFLKLRREGMPEDTLRSKGIRFCTAMNIQTERVCVGAITLHLPTILYIVDAKPNLTETTICGVLLESQSCPLTDDEYNWTITIDNDPPTPVQPEDSDDIINIVHITDIHYDPNYEPYGNSDCGEPTCCRRGQNDTNVSGKLAGHWGDYNSCDSPWHTVVDVLDHIKATHENISYVYFTGDIIDHGVWETSVEANMKSLNKSYHQIYETFRNIPVYPILGNHESHPVNQFPPTSVTASEINIQWLYNMMADLWINEGWLPESTRSTILKGGYYTFSPKKGFRIIALNNNVCYCDNWWLWYQPKDPEGQLQWLADTLLQAEKNGELVHILAHIPVSSNECQSTWKREYLKIVDRYAHIIRAQFNGHTHNDELQLYYSSSNNTRINNVAWTGGSATAFSKLNPNYKVYAIDSNNYLVKDFENWIYNLTLANENADQHPKWYMSYSFRKEYNISDLSYDSLNTWFTRLTNDENLLSSYYRHFFKLAEPSLRKECDSKCMKTYTCRIIACLEPKSHCN